VTPRRASSGKRKAPPRRPRTFRKTAGKPIAIKRVYDEASPGDGLRILVDRLWPRGIAKAALKLDTWARELAPSNELRKWYGHEPARFAEFRRRYRAELAPHRAELAALGARIAGRTATLLTATRETALSHAHVLRDLLAAKR